MDDQPWYAELAGGRQGNRQRGCRQERQGERDDRDRLHRQGGRDDQTGIADVEESPLPEPVAAVHGERDDGQERHQGDEQEADAGPVPPARDATDRGQNQGEREGEGGGAGLAEGGGRE